MQPQQEQNAHLLNSLSCVIFVLVFFFHPVCICKTKVQVDYSEIIVHLS